MGDGHEEILARLNPGSPDTEATPASTGDVLTPATVAHAIALVEDRIGALLLIIRVADQWSWYTELERRVVDEVLAKAYESKWRVQRPRELRGLVTCMSRIALFEHCIPGLCRTCKGRGKRFPADGPVRDCERCGGSGHYTKMSERERAIEAGLDPRGWRRSWSSRYSWIQRMLTEHDATAARQLVRLLHSK